MPQTEHDPRPAEVILTRRPDGKVARPAVPVADRRSPAYRKARLAQIRADQAAAAKKRGRS